MEKKQNDDLRQYPKQKKINYVVVTFNENVYSTVPKKWLMESDTTQYCQWPYKNAESAIKQAIDPIPEKWSRYPVKIIAEYSLYSNAIKKENMMSKSSTDTTSESMNDSQQDSDLNDAQVFPETVSNDRNEQAENSSTDIDSPETEIDNNSVAREFFEIQDMFKRMSSLLVETKYKVEQKLNDIKELKNVERREQLRQRLPVNSLENLKTLEKTLNQPEMKQAMSDILLSQGELNGRDFLKQGLEKLFTVNLAKVCSWAGQQNNFAVNNLAVLKILKDVVQAAYPDFRDEDFKDYTMKWYQQKKKNK